MGPVHFLAGCSTKKPNLGLFFTFILWYDILGVWCTPDFVMLGGLYSQVLL